jgi:allantoin racemase
MTKPIKMIVPVPLPPEALANFAAQIPPGLLDPAFPLEFVGVRNGPMLADSYYEMLLFDAAVLDAGQRAEAEGFAAVCINSMSDSALNALRSRLTIPVVGPAQTAFLLACSLGKKFSVLTMWPEWFPLYEKTLTEQGLYHRLASLRSIDMRPDTAELLAGKEEIAFARLAEEGRKAILEDGADVIILGSTTMHQSHSYLAAQLPVPVINPGLVAYEMCRLLLTLGLSHSKKAYPAPERLSDHILASIPSLF